MRVGAVVMQAGSPLGAMPDGAFTEYQLLLDGRVPGLLMPDETYGMDHESGPLVVVGKFDGEGVVAVACDDGRVLRLPYDGDGEVRVSFFMALEMVGAAQLVP